MFDKTTDFVLRVGIYKFVRFRNLFGNKRIYDQLLRYMYLYRVARIISDQVIHRNQIA